MNFTDAHIAILDKYREHWDSLRTAGFMRNIDRPVFDALQRVYNEAIAPTKYPAWCPACVAEMVRVLYMNFDSWNQPKAESDVPEEKANKGGGKKRTVLGKVQPRPQGNAQA